MKTLSTIADALSEQVLVKLGYTRIQLLIQQQIDEAISTRTRARIQGERKSKRVGFT